MSPSVGRKRYGSPTVNVAVVAVVDLQLVVERQRGAGERALEHARRVHGRLERRGARPAGSTLHGARLGPERADHDAAVAVRMGAEERVGVGRAARDELVGVGHVLLLTDLGVGKPPGSPEVRAAAAHTLR